MDRLISDEERIRRAEDVLERRRNTDLRISSDNFKKNVYSNIGVFVNILWNILCEKFSKWENKNIYFKY